MHIPDGFLDAKTSASTALLSLAVVAYAFRKLKDVYQNKLVPVMGVMAAFIFAAQMFNFPIAAGTSGHLLGGVLAAVLLGPYAAVVVMMSVLIVQCLLFQDGGLIVLGANVLNMAVVGTLGGYIVFLGFKKIFKGRFAYTVGVFAASWLSVVLGSVACALELGISGTAPFGAVVPAMAGVHAIIGVGEGVITLLVISFVRQVKPEWVELKWEEGL